MSDTRASNFLMLYAAVVVRLSQLLEFQFLPGSRHSQTYIGQLLYGVIERHNAGDLRGRTVELLKLEYLVKHLTEIQKYDVNLLRDYSKALNSCMREQEYYGLRMEIYTTASLIRGKLNFKKQESPDFHINSSTGDLFIECSSVHLSQPKDGDIMYKIGSVITKKSKKRYANAATALFIDITNIMFHSFTNDTQKNWVDLRETVQERLEDSKLGGVLLFSTTFPTDLSAISTGYIRVDNQNTATSLTSLLDEIYPKNRGNYPIEPIIISFNS